MELYYLIKEIWDIIGNKGKDERDGLFFIGTEEVKKVGFAVDPSLTAIEKAAKEKVSLLVTHHHIHPHYEFKKDRVKTGVLLSKKLKILAQNNISLASFHAPLDFSEIGNFKTMMSEVLGFERGEMLLDYKDAGKVIPTCVLPQPLDIKKLMERLREIGFEPKSHLFLKTPIKRIVVDTGAGGCLDVLEEIYPWKPDLYITGEAQHQHFRNARDLGINIMFVGHYNSEKIGLKKLMENIKNRYPELECMFIEDENPY